ncbi:MAG: rhomboid family intramembrane serine protease [Microbacteriaceae bacterium]|nr:rhomboid family intramembrane serine protease [Microbacteriaceae bacterium]
MTDPQAGSPRPGAGARVCYRHPDRPSAVRCQRCDRAICPECQTPAPVGVQCPECVAAARAALPKRPSAVVRAFRPGSRVPVASYSILGLTLVVYVLQWITQGAVTSALAYFPPLTAIEPWRMLTVALVHSDSSILHIVFNMYSLWVLGPLLESLIGRARFAAVYVLSALGGSVAVLWLAPLTVVVGASGAIFGLLGAFFVIQRRLGGRNVQLVVIIAINLALGFLIPGVSWQSHVGGLLVGAVLAWVMLRTRRADQQRRQATLIALVAAALVAATVLRLTLF